MAVVLRCLARTAALRTMAEMLKPCTTIVQPHALSSGFSRLPKISDIDLSKLPEFETSNDPKEWQFVERLIPLEVIPEPKEFKDKAPSGWVPQKDEAFSLPYFIRRTKSHMEPVYLFRSNRNLRKITIIRYIEGDIWQLESELKKYLEKHNGKKYYAAIGSRVNEMCGQIRFRGDHVNWIKKWMHMKGL